MDFEKQNKLPEGIGKRIIEALKTTSDNDVEIVPGFELDFQNNYFENNSAETYNEPEYPEYKNYNYEISSHNPPQEEKVIPVQYREQQNINNEQNGEAIEASNIDILIDLVTKLPPGVTKQTGAQIIRHTMEAMGIPMNQVLTKAQMVQEELDCNIKNNINTIEEYRLKIKSLDQEIQQFRKKTHDLEDIVNLFILSDKR